MDKYIGKRLDGRYEIREIIGVGGMAYVYKAYDTIDDRTVAVKILKEEFLNNEEFLRRFKNESKAIAILSHPNIVKVYDVSLAENLQYIVMEYIDGITLKEYMDQQHDIRWKEAVHFTVQILRALQHAHDKGIVHRDIKPQNIMLLSDGTIKVTDFGIARFSRQDLRATSEDKAIGSVHYISPEQARGEITDEKADIYSVGVMLYEMLTGRVPFDADNAVSVAIMQLQSEPTAPREIKADIPEGLEEITLKAMQKEPESRYQSAAEMLSDIDEFKRNPSIHFEYKYFVDETPTRFVEAITKVRGDMSEEEPEEGEEDEEEKKSTFLPVLAAIAGAVLLVCLIFVGVVLFITLSGGGTPAEEFVVDDFTNASYNEVISTPEYIAKYNFNTPVEMYNDAPAGTIIDQDPAPNRTAKIKCNITFTVSMGPNLIQIPAVSQGEDSVTVYNRLTNAGFKVEEVRQSSDEVEEGCVIKVNPAYPNSVKAETTIYMYVSNGPTPVEPKKVPDVTNISQADAIRMLAASNFIVNTENIKVVNKTGYAEGTVILQEPAKGTLLEPGSEVMLTVASGFSDITDVIVPLPDVNVAVDLKVFIDGRESKLPEHSTDLQGLLASQLRSIKLNFTEMKESYTVSIHIRKTGAAASTYEPYLEYTMNGKEGRASLDQQYTITWVTVEDPESSEPESSIDDPAFSEPEVSTDDPASSEFETSLPESTTTSTEEQPAESSESAVEVAQ